MKSSIVKIILVLLLFSLLNVGCQKISKYSKIIIIFKKIYSLHQGSIIKMDNVKIGEVTNISQKGKKIYVIAKIYKDYFKKITFGSKFYIIPNDDESFIEVRISDYHAQPLKNNSTIYGSTYSEYLIEKTKKEAKKFLKKSYKKINDYFNSSEWKNLKEDVTKRINEIAKQGDKTLEKQLPKIKKQTENIIKKSPEAVKRMNAYIDSLLQNHKKGISNEN